MTDDTGAEHGPETEPQHADAGPGAEPRPGAELEDVIEAEVAAVRERLAGLDQRPVEEHVAVFEEADQRLRRALGTTRPEE